MVKKRDGVTSHVHFENIRGDSRLMWRFSGIRPTHALLAYI